MRRRLRQLGASIVGTAVVLGTPAVTGASSASAPPLCGGRSATIVGTPGDDLLSGTSGRDVIVGNGGDDVIRARGGDDVVCGGAGDDTVYGGEGDDRISGGEGADTVEGGPGHDGLGGGPGVDTLRMVTASATIVDLADGWSIGAGTDTLERFEVLAGSGTASYDVRTGPSTQAVQTRGPHEDTVRTADAAADATAGPRLSLSLGEGSDIYLVRQPDVVVVEDLPDVSTGRDVVDVSTAGTTTIFDGAGGLRVDAAGSGSEVISVRAVDGAIRLDTGDGEDRLDVHAVGGSVTWFAGPGRDRLSGSLPADSEIKLGLGADVVFALRSESVLPVEGAGGIDRIAGGTGADVVDLARGLWRWDDATLLFVGFEQAYGGPGDDDLRGNGVANALQGGSGSDRLHGRPGTDVLKGGVGDDSADGGSGADRCVAEAVTSCEAR